VTITARTGSYGPANVQVRAGVPATLVVRSDNAQGCVRSFLIPARGVDEILPTRGESRIELGVLEPGKLHYSCGMGMYTGTITAA
jgi:plastocyanin domain-containing protein